MTDVGRKTPPAAGPLLDLYGDGNGNTPQSKDAAENKDSTENKDATAKVSLEEELDGSGLKRAGRLGKRATVTNPWYIDAKDKTVKRIMEIPAQWNIWLINNGFRAVAVHDYDATPFSKELSPSVVSMRLKKWVVIFDGNSVAVGERVRNVIEKEFRSISELQAALECSNPSDYQVRWRVKEEKTNFALWSHPISRDDGAVKEVLEQLKAMNSRLAEICDPARAQFYLQIGT